MEVIQMMKLFWEDFKTVTTKMFQKKLDSLETGESKTIYNK